MVLIALNFTYVGDEKAETFHFYKRILRGFLRWHRTKAVWLKGSGQRKAYLLLVDRLVENAKKMFYDGLTYGGHFQAQAVDPIQVLKEAEEIDYETAGYLAYSNVELGDSDDMWCPMESYRKVNVGEYCIGNRSEGQKPCPYWSWIRCTYPKRWQPEETSSLWGEKEAFTIPNSLKRVA